MKDIYIYKKVTHPINLNNSGTMNQQNLDFAKRTMLFDTIREHIELVKTKQGYPQGDISEVEMTIDCVIMSKKRYDKLMYPGESDTNESEYLKFPKLEP